MPSFVADALVSSIERLITRLKGRPFTVDRRIPLRIFLTVVLRRAIWLARGIAKTTLLQGRTAFVFMAPGVHLRNASLCHFGKGVTLETGVLIDGLSEKGIHLGDNVLIGAYSQLRASVLSNLGVTLRFGDGSACEAYSFIGAAGPVNIGKNVLLGQHASFHAENHIFTSVDVPIQRQGVTRIGITIDDDCWVGANVTFLDGCKVGRGCVVAAGSVVRGEIPPFSVIGGVPAKIIRSRLAPSGDASGEAQ
jgi:acetyltransferase-like isoleucine patch superfamily enzyme